MPKLISTEHFLELWNKHQSVAELQKITGLSQRALYQRRRRIEAMMGIELPSREQIKTYVDAYHVIIKVELKNGQIMVGSDPHYHPEIPPSTAHRAFVKFLPKFSPEVVVMNGDIWDFASISRHHRIGWSKQPTVQQEIEVAQERLDEIFRASRNARHVRTIGNHDLRMDGTLSNLVPQFEGVKGTRLRDHFPGWEEAWTIQVNDPCELLILHRWKSSLHAPLIQAKEAGCSVVTGHRHQASEYEHSFINFREVYGIDAGTMAELHDGPNPVFTYTEGRPLNWRAGWWLLTFREGKLMPPDRCRVLEKGVVWFRGERIVV